MAATLDDEKAFNGDTGVGSDRYGSSIYVGGRDTLYGVLRQFVSDVFSSVHPKPLLRRIKESFVENAPKIPVASRNTASDVIDWTRRGSPIRALFVISVGTITLLALTGLLVFTLFFVAATLNAIIVSFLVSLAAAGGFLALFFAFLAVIYIGALSVAIFAISTTTFVTIFAVIIATGWVGFFWVLWLVASKSLNITKRSISITGSAISAYSSARTAGRRAPTKSTG